MSKTKSLLKGLLSTAVGLSLVACAQQENPLKVGEGTFRPMPRAEVLQEGLSDTDNYMYRESSLSPLLLETQLEDTPFREIQAITLSISVDAKTNKTTYKKMLKRVNYYLEEMPMDQKAGDSMDESVNLAAVKRPYVVPALEIETYTTDEKLGKAVITKFEDQVGKLGELKLGKNTEQSLNNLPFDNLPLIDATPITADIILVSRYDIEIVDGQKIPVLKTSQYYRRILKSELDAMEAALIDVENKMSLSIEKKAKQKLDAELEEQKAVEAAKAEENKESALPEKDVKNESEENKSGEDETEIKDADAVSLAPESDDAA
jgi:hypothetical protein